MSCRELTDTDIERIKLSISEGRKNGTYAFMSPQDLEDLVSYVLIVKEAVGLRQNDYLYEMKSLQMEMDKLREESSNNFNGIVELSTKYRAAKEEIAFLKAEKVVFYDANVQLNSECSRAMEDMSSLRAQLEELKGAYGSGVILALANICNAFKLNHPTTDTGVEDAIKIVITGIEEKLRENKKWLL